MQFSYLDIQRIKVLQNDFAVIEILSMLPKWVRGRKKKKKSSEQRQNDSILKPMACSCLKEYKKSMQNIIQPNYS